MTMWGEVNEGSVSHFVCGATSARVQVVATPTAGGDNASGTVAATSGAQSRLFSEATGEDSTNAARSTRAGISSSVDERPRVNTEMAATTRVATTVESAAESTAGAVKTAQAVLGAAGGIAGVVAMFF